MWQYKEQCVILITLLSARRMDTNSAAQGDQKHDENISVWRPPYEIWGSRSGDYKLYNILWCDAV
jgi:hypothetical protein